MHVEHTTTSALKPFHAQLDESRTTLCQPPPPSPLVSSSLFSFSQPPSDFPRPPFLVFSFQISPRHHPFTLLVLPPLCPFSCFQPHGRCIFMHTLLTHPDPILRSAAAAAPAVGCCCALSFLASPSPVAFVRSCAAVCAPVCPSSSRLGSVLELELVFLRYSFFLPRREGRTAGGTHNTNKTPACSHGQRSNNQPPLTHTDGSPSPISLRSRARRSEKTTQPSPLSAALCGPDSDDALVPLPPSPPFPALTLAWGLSECNPIASPSH